MRWRPKFLQVLLESAGDIKKACAAAGILPMIAYQARRRDPDFEEDWIAIGRIVEEQRADEIESSLVERAINGSPRVRYDPKGRVVEESRDHDTPAAALLLKAYRPVKFREKQEPSASDAIKTVADLFRLAHEIRAFEQQPPPALPAAPAAPQPAPTAIVVSDKDTN